MSLNQAWEDVVALLMPSPDSVDTSTTPSSSVFSGSDTSIAPSGSALDGVNA